MDVPRGNEEPPSPGNWVKDGWFIGTISLIITGQWFSFSFLMTDPC